MPVFVNDSSQQPRDSCDGFYTIENNVRLRPTNSSALFKMNLMLEICLIASAKQHFQVSFCCATCV